MGGAPIPWAYTDLPGTLQWTWLTDHLVARIWAATAEVDGVRHVRAYSWELCDRMSTGEGMPRLLVEGTAPSFDEAERCVREHVGKAYDPRLGYRAFSGTEATTFTLATGERRDLGPLVGTRCRATVLLPGGERTVVSGDLAIQHYSLELRDGERTRELTPEHVEQITHRSAAAEQAAGILGGDGHVGIGRMYRAEWTRGCTGTPGFEVGTVDHGQAAPCPIHERQSA